MSPERRSSFLAEHVDRLARIHLRDLLKDAERGKRLRHRSGSILLDLSRQKLDDAALQALGEHAEASGWQAARDAMFAGEPINASEQRAVLHTALRASGSQLPSPAPREALQEIEQTLQRIDALVHAVGLGDASSLGLASGITDVVNIGIGGSDLGPRLAVRALAPYHVPGLRSHFLTNVDGQSAYELMHQLDPKRTLVVVVSKTFTTQETLLNGTVLRDWIRRG
jgi:glucose-6-phosphate isomerase